MKQRRLPSADSSGGRDDSSSDILGRGAARRPYISFLPHLPTRSLSGTRT
jgi:hypothetical protein